MDNFFTQKQKDDIKAAYIAFLQRNATTLESLLQNVLPLDLIDIKIEYENTTNKRPETVYQSFIDLFTIYLEYLQTFPNIQFVDWVEQAGRQATINGIITLIEGIRGFGNDKNGDLWSYYFGPNIYGTAIKTTMSPASTGGVVNPVPQCLPNEYNYKFEPKIRELTEEPDQIINGINAGKQVVLEYTLRRCCTRRQGTSYTGDPVKLKGATDQFTVRIKSELVADAQKCDNSDVLGKITYKRYFNVRTIAQTLYDSLDIVVDNSFLLLPILLGKTNIYSKNQSICETLNSSTPKDFKAAFNEFGNNGLELLTWASTANMTQYSNWTEQVVNKDVINIGKQVTSNANNILLERFLLDAGFSPADLLNSTKITDPSAQALSTFNDVKGKTLLIPAQATKFVDGCGGTDITPPKPPVEQTQGVVVDSCNTPYDSNRKLQWSLRKKEVNKPEYFQDIFDYKNDYNNATKLFNNLELQYPVDIKDGSVRIKTGKSFDTNQNINIRKTSLNKIERKQLASNPCYSATAETFIMDIKRRRKVYLELVCGVNANIPVKYFSPSGINDRIEIPIDDNGVINLLTNTTFGDKIVNGVIFSGEKTRGQFVTSLALRDYGNRIQREDSGEFAGMWYIWEDIYYPLLDQSGNRNFISDISDEATIQFNKNSQNCEPGEYCIDKGWIPDPTDLCGCVEVSVQECYDVYPELVYTDAFGMVKKLSERLILKTYPYNPDYPFLTKGQRVVNTRRSTAAACDPSPIKLYHPLLYGGDILPGVSKNEVFGIFNGSGSLLCYNTSSIQPTETKKQYYDIVGCDNCDTSPLYAVTYGHYEGSGSAGYNYDYSDSSTKAIYSQFRLLALDPTDTRFTFYNSGTVQTPKDVYIINYYRNGLTHRLDLGNFEINLAELNGTAYANKYYTGSNVQVSSSNKILSLIDNSGDIDESQFCLEDPNSYYDIVSGSLLGGTHSSGTGSNITTYGKIYHNLGIIVLDGSKLNSYLNFNSVTGSNLEGNNALKLHTSISGAAVLNKPMQGRRVKTKTTNHYFIRIPVEAANYSTNPTYVLDTADKKGYIKHDCFIENPVTYITTVGLFNDKNEMLAVAKLNKPIQKSYENDILIKIRLNW